MIFNQKSKIWCSNITHFLVGVHLNVCVKLMCHYSQTDPSAGSRHICQFWMFYVYKCTSVCTYALINEPECLFSRLPFVVTWMRRALVSCTCRVCHHVHASVYSCCMCQKAKTNTVCQPVCKLLRWLMWTQTLRRLQRNFSPMKDKLDDWLYLWFGQISNSRSVQSIPIDSHLISVIAFRHDFLMSYFLISF